MDVMNRFWRYFGLFVVVVALIVGISIWYSSKQYMINTDASIEKPIQSTANSQTASPNSIPKEAPANYPAPAKKLHTVLSEANKPQADALQEKIDALNQQLTELNAQLAALGITVPDSDISTQSDSSDSDIRERLNSIQQHMEQKGQ